jgi:hypothetical protein
MSKTCKNRSNRRGGAVDKNATRKCKSFLKKKQQKMIADAKDLYSVFAKQAKQKVKDKDKLKQRLQNIKKFTTVDKKTLALTDKINKIIYCNVGCKGTILEPGEKISSTLAEKYKDSKELLKLFENQRKNIFGEKTDVLKDNFYKKAPKKLVEEIKKDGAISLCSPVTKK